MQRIPLNLESHGPIRYKGEEVKAGGRGGKWTSQELVKGDERDPEFALNTTKYLVQSCAPLLPNANLRTVIPCLPTSSWWKQHELRAQKRCLRSLKKEHPGFQGQVACELGGKAFVWVKMVTLRALRISPTQVGNAFTAETAPHHGLCSDLPQGRITEADISSLKNLTPLGGEQIPKSKNAKEGSSLHCLWRWVYSHLREHLNSKRRAFFWCQESSPHNCRHGTGSANMCLR